MKNIFGIAVTDEDFNYFYNEQRKGKILKVDNDKIIAVDYVPSEKEIAEKRIKELKQKLADTDYEAIKYAEGVMTDAEYAPYKADRQKWRAEINELEKIIKI